jgi:hypothetical protein
MVDTYRIEYSKDGNEVCIIPMGSIPWEDFHALSNLFIKKGFEWWLPADERCGYLFSKVKKDGK